MALVEQRRKTVTAVNEIDLLNLCRNDPFIGQHIEPCVGWLRQWEAASGLTELQELWREFKESLGSSPWAFMRPQPNDPASITEVDTNRAICDCDERDDGLRVPSFH